MKRKKRSKPEGGAIGRLKKPQAALDASEWRWACDGSTKRANPSPYNTNALLGLSAIALWRLWERKQCEYIYSFFLLLWETGLGDICTRVLCIDSNSCKTPPPARLRKPLYLFICYHAVVEVSVLSVVGTPLSVFFFFLKKNYLLCVYFN